MVHINLNGYIYTQNKCVFQSHVSYIGIRIISHTYLFRLQFYHDPDNIISYAWLLQLVVLVNYAQTNLSSSIQTFIDFRNKTNARSTTLSLFLC